MATLVEPPHSRPTGDAHSTYRIDLVKLAKARSSTCRPSTPRAPSDSRSIGGPPPPMTLIVPRPATATSQSLASINRNIVRYTPGGSPVENRAHDAAATPPSWNCLRPRLHGIDGTDRRTRLRTASTGLSSSRNRRSGGSGLGLAIVSGILAARRGNASDENQAGPQAPRQRGSESAVPFAIIAMGQDGRARAISPTWMSSTWLRRGEMGTNEAPWKATRLAQPRPQCSGPGTQAAVDRGREPAAGAQRRLVRTIESYRRYWDKWAQTWEVPRLCSRRARAPGDDRARLRKAAQACGARQRGLRGGRARRASKNSISAPRLHANSSSGAADYATSRFTRAAASAGSRTRCDCLSCGCARPWKAIGALREGGYIARSTPTGFDHSCYRCRARAPHAAPATCASSWFPTRTATCASSGQAMDRWKRRRDPLGHRRRAR